MTEKTHEVIPAEKLAIGQPRAGELHPLVEALKNRELTPEIVEKMLVITREYDKDRAKKAYVRAIVELRRDLPPWIDRDKEVKFNQVRYTHTSLAHAMQTVLPALTKHGFNLGWTPAIQNQKVAVTATLTHQDGHSESATLEAPADSSGSKSAAQAIASTVTLLERYTALALLGIATSDMTEPTHNAESSADGEAIDSAKNLRVLPEILKAGKTKEQAEDFAGKPIQKWTAGDLAKLKAWITPPAPEREPGEDEAPAPEPPPPVVEKLDVPIGKPEIAKITAWMKEYVLGKVAFSDLVESELGRRATGQDMTLREFGVIEEAFTKVRSGRWEIKDKKFSKPPEEEPKF